jgi:cyclopropane fatty-acyl-phospholipid synthase-like methyltransferase
MKKIQKIQDLQYKFPYHYIVEYEPYFTQTKSWQWGINYAATLDLIISKLNPDKYKSILDIGTGDGRLVYELSKKYPKKKIIGVDYSKRAINLAKALYPKGKFFYKDIARANLRQEVDAITLIEVAEHILPSKLNVLIRSVASLLKKDGSLFVTVPHSNIQVQKKHFQHFNSNSLKKIFYKDYKVKEIRFLGKQGWQYQSILKLLENKLFILNEKNLLNSIYKYYKNNIFFCKESECSRVYLELLKK